MNRRMLFRLLAAMLLAGCGVRETTAKGLRVVVTGAGIVGASVAYHLARAGAAVTVIDRAGPATHASRGSFAWINATWAKQPRHYHALNRDGVSGWHELGRALKIPLRWSGSLEWLDDAGRQSELGELIAEQAAWGEPARMVGAAELPALEPEVDFGDAAQAAFSGNDGAVDPVAATGALLAAAAAMGADIRHPCELTAVGTRSGRLSRVETSLGTIKADRLVLATGAAPDAPQRFGGIHVPQRSTPGIIAITAPAPPLLRRVIAAPGVHMHQRNDGRIVIGEQAGAPRNEAHALRLAGRPNAFPTEEIGLEHAQRMLSTAKLFVPRIAAATIEAVYIGWRPLPLDGHPVLGASPERPDVYLAITHSGVTLAPIVGQLAAFELAEGRSVERLDAYRPDREFELIERY